MILNHFKLISVKGTTRTCKDKSGHIFWGWIPASSIEMRLQPPQHTLSDHLHLKRHLYMIVSYLMPSFERPAPSLHQEATELLRFLVTPHPILQSFQNLPVMVSRFPRLAGLFTGGWFVCTVLSLGGGAFAVVHLRAGDRYIIWPILQTNQHS